MCRINREMNDDTQLLKQYAGIASEQAFRELVERHIQLVNSTALRMVAGDVHLAKDVTQVVFTDLARKAASLPGDIVLGGWLHRHTCYTAAKTVRTEIRRRDRERIAMEINDANESSPPESHWQQLASVLDDALNHLGAQDRDAIVLRYLQSRDLRSIGLTIGTSEDAAQKRISRALEKLRRFLTHRGITLSGASLATDLDAGAKPPVPHGLAASISAAALSGATTAKTAFTLTILKTMTTSKLSLTLASVVALVGVTVVVVDHMNPATTDTAVVVKHGNSIAATVADAAPAVAQPAMVVVAVPAPEPAAPTLRAEARTVAAQPAPEPVASGKHRAQIGHIVYDPEDLAFGRVSPATTDGSDNSLAKKGDVIAPVAIPDRIPDYAMENADGSATYIYVRTQGAPIVVTEGIDGTVSSRKGIPSDLFLN